MKKLLFSAALVVAAVASALWSYSSYGTKETGNNLFNENVEVLAQGEAGTSTCTRAVVTGICYRWVTIAGVKSKVPSSSYIAMVENYTVIDGTPVTCFHDKVTTCPAGTFM